MILNVSEAVLWHACLYALDLNTHKFSAKSGYFNTAHNIDLTKRTVARAGLPFLLRRRGTAIKAARFDRVREGGSPALLAVRKADRLDRSMRRTILAFASMLAVSVGPPTLTEASRFRKGPRNAQGTPPNRQPGLRPVKATLAPSPDARCASTRHVCRWLRLRLGRSLASLA